MLQPAQILFDGIAAPAPLPVCDHYAGSEKLMRKSLALQHQLGPVFDLTLDCEDGAAVGREAEHAALVAGLLSSEDNRYGRVGVRIHDFSHPAWRDDLRIILGQGNRAPAYITLPKINHVDEVRQIAEVVDASQRATGRSGDIPLHVLVETHDALRHVFALAALPRVESISFGLMDFVSAHGGAIPDAAMRSPGQFEHPLVRRAKLEIAAACHAFGKVPAHNVSTDIRDMSAVANDAQRARDEFGYLRMWSIHPDQIEPIVRTFAPDAASLQTATAILLAAQAADWGPIRFEGRLHDRASYRYYWSLLQRGRLLADKLGAIMPAESAGFFATDTK